MIRDRLRTSYSRQKSYVDNRRRDHVLEVDYWVYLKISSMKWLMMFGKEGNLSHQYVRPYEIVKQVVKVAYELKLQKLDSYMGT